MTPAEFARWLCDQLQDDLDSFEFPRVKPADPGSEFVLLELRGQRFALKVFDYPKPPKRKDTPQ